MPTGTHDTTSVMVVIPTYNEVEALPVLLAELAQLQVPGLRAVVVDDAPLTAPASWPTTWPAADGSTSSIARPKTVSAALTSPE